jgi:rSAM/selenodomain-associated transferase 1
VYIVAKAPRPGAAKTRLGAALGPAPAAVLALAFLRDTITTVRIAGLEPRIICRDTVETAALQQLLRGTDCTVTSQEGEGLGAALESAFRQGLTGASDAVAVLGADSPTLPPPYLRAAFAHLDRGADVVLGPARDGGYYLLAARAVHPALFRAMPWSTSIVAQETLQRCGRAHLRVSLLPTWYDVDDAASLRQLCADLARSAPEVAAHTRAALACFAPEADEREPDESVG